MKRFTDFAKYYNLLYKEKNYKEEVEYVNSMISKYSKIDVKDVLDIGCGTGTHASFLASKGYNICGIDLSESMIEIAKQKENERLKFIVGNMTDFSLEKKFDAIISLFDVICYQTLNGELDSFFSNIAKHLKSGGVFIFDCWYGPAVLSDPPAKQVKRIEDDEIFVTRIAEPVMYPNENVVEVNYDFFIKDKKSGQIDNFNEKHRVRYLFKTEIDRFIEDNNLKLIHFEELLSGNEPNFKTWKVCWVVTLK